MGDGAMRMGVSAPTLAVAGLILIAVALHLIWLERFRRGFLTEWDEAGYIQIAVLDRAGLAHDGLLGLARAVVTQPAEAPLVPLTTVAVYLVAGVGIFASLLVLPLFFAFLLVATYALARELVDPWWAVLATAVVAAIPGVIDYTRLYHFSVPAALWATAALWALIHSDGFRNRWSSLGLGAALGLMVLTRTMTLAYLPGFGLAAVVQLLHGRRTASRVANVGLASLTALAVAATWYARNISNVWSYLSSAGYGSTSGTYGRGHPLISVAYWTKELSLVVEQLYVPLAVAIAACFVVWAAANVRVSRRPHLGNPRTRAALTILIVLVTAYVALTSSKNEGTAFALPLLPPLVLLAVVALTNVRASSLRAALAAALVAVALANVVMKSGFVDPLARPRWIDLPILHRVPVFDGYGIIQEEVAGAGYPVGSPTQPLLGMHRLWTPDTEHVVRFIRARAANAHVAPRVLVAADDGLFNNTRLRLASALLSGEYMPVGRLTPSTTGDRVTTYVLKIHAYRANAIVVTRAAPGSARTITLSKIAAAARQTGFRRARRFSLPDGRPAWVWLNLSRAAASGHN
jgi:Dolichyl-phosphate-mannose-protein mannosyltransferase